MKITKKQTIGENLLYVMVWSAIILVPVLNSLMMSELHVSWENVLIAWRKIAPYLIIFIVHNSVIAPRFMLKHKYWKYLITNLTLIIGTFWFRTEQRKGEMGLRIALGSTRFSLKGIMIAEGVLLLTLIAIPALLICFNLHVSELTKGFYMDYTIARFVEGFFITYLVMAVMIILGIWYPAHQMVRLEPADALRYE